MKKKKWIKPKLIILTRGKPEEGVLGACKFPSVDYGPGVVHNWCVAIDEVCEVNCAAFQAS